MVITGPLIRVLGERYSWVVKSAVLDSIYHLLVKVDVALKPFLPQLQTTFLKCLNDPNNVVRLKSGYALSKLVTMNPKIDQMMLEVNNFIKNSEENPDATVKLTLINSLRLCLNNICEKLTDETRMELLRTLRRDTNMYNDDINIRAVSAGAIGSLLYCLNEAEQSKLLKELTNVNQTSSWKQTQANCMIIGIAYKYNLLEKLKDNKDLAKFLLSNSNSDRVNISLSLSLQSNRFSFIFYLFSFSFLKSQTTMSVLRAFYFYISYQFRTGRKVETEIAQALAKGINSSSSEVKSLAIDLASLLVKNHYDQLKEDNNLLKAFVPMLMNGTREREPSIRSKSEVAFVSIMRHKKPDSILAVNY